MSQGRQMPRTPQRAVPPVVGEGNGGNSGANTSAIRSTSTSSVMDASTRGYNEIGFVFLFFVEYEF
jgi:hypothetical protein